MYEMSSIHLAESRQIHKKPFVHSRGLTVDCKEHPLEIESEVDVSQMVAFSYSLETKHTLLYTRWLPISA